LEGSFNRPNRPFFAAGACHILAHALLTKLDEELWYAVFIEPKLNFSGMHVFVTNGIIVLDYHGTTAHETYIEHYVSKMQRFFPGWQCSFKRLKISTIGKDFCDMYKHRMPDQYYRDPLPRAYEYATKLLGDHA